MLQATIVMAGVALIMLIVSLLRDPSMTWQGVRGGGTLLWQILPLLAAAMLIAGLVQVLIPREIIARWLGAESGWKGIFIGCFAGALTPGGPFVSFPIAAAIYRSGASIGPIVAYIAAWNLWAVNRLPMEFALLGPRVTLIRLASTLLFPPLAGFLAQSFLGRFVH